MRTRLLIGVVVAGLGVAEARAQDAKATLDAAAKALGAANLNSIQFSGRGSDYIFGQPYDPKLSLAAVQPARLHDHHRLRDARHA